MGEKNKLSSQFNPNAMRIRYIILPRSLYDAYFEFYKLAQDAMFKAEETMLDGIHQHAMVTGRRHFENMPDEKLFIQRIYNMQERLKVHKAYIRYARVKERLGHDEPTEYVYLTPKQAIEFDNLLKDSAALFNDTIYGVWKTDYLRNMTRLKNEGRPYNGKTCLQEIINMAVGIIRVQHMTQELVHEGKIIPEWKTLINGPPR